MMTKHLHVVVLAISATLVIGCAGGSTDAPLPTYGETSHSLAQSGASYTFPVGSLIVPMDITYQNGGMFKAYGLLYRLLQNGIPVSWVIRPSKVLCTSSVSSTCVSQSATTADFTVAASDFVTSAAISPAHAYRGGPFVIDQPHAAAAAPIITAWNAALAAGVKVTVHRTTAAFIGHVKRQLVAAPTIAMFQDGNENIAVSYLVAAGIPDSTGDTTWAATSPDLLTPIQVAGATCPQIAIAIAASPNGATQSGAIATYTTTTPHGLVIGDIVDIAGVGIAGYVGRMTVTGIVSTTRFSTTLRATGLASSGGGTSTKSCTSTPHSDGGLFDGNGQPAYCQMMSMHWGVGNADTTIGREVVREYRAFLRNPVHLYGQCQAVNAIENNTDAPYTLAGSPSGATQAGTTATFATTTSHSFQIGEHVLVGGVGIVGYNRTWRVTGVPTPLTFTAVSTALPQTSGLAASGGGTVRGYNGLFLTNAGYLIGADPAPISLLNSDEPFAQLDGAFTTVGGSERAYTLPPGESYKAQDVVFMTESPAAGFNDLWMTGYLDGQCSTLSEFCDPQFAQGKVSYLGGHQYSVATPITSNGGSQGTRLFLNALMEAPCATDLGAASIGLSKSAPASSNGSQVTYTITAFNNGSATAGSVVISDPLTAGVAFVPPNPPSTISAIARATNVVTVTTTAAHGFIVGDRVTVNGVTNNTFDGTFTVAAIVSTTQFRYAQTAANASSSGGTVRRALDGVCIGTAAQCGGSGGGIVTINVGSLGAGQSAAVAIRVQYQTPAIYSNTAQVTYKAAATTLTATSNTTSTCYYAGTPAICAAGCDVNAPACANNCDDDGDGIIDFPDDLGCHAGTDTDETNFASTGPIKARVLVVFDTSGSMTWNTCRDDFTGGDGSLSCPGFDVACTPSPPGCGASGCGNGIADDSRLFKVKTGISNVVNGFGEVEWGLMKFRQLPTQFSCGTLNVNKNDGGWQGASASPCTGFAAGDVVVNFDPENTNSLLAYMDGSTNYPGAPPPGKDFELRASGNTPLGGSLASARTYIAQTRSTDSALVAGCRPYRVILVTDGAETCAGDPAMQAGALFATGDLDGRVPVHVIGFSTPNVAVQAQLNQIAAAGGTSSYVSADDAAQLSSAIESIVAGTILKELCNNLDDDCDGAIDEDFPDKNTSCNNGGAGACARTGVRVCRNDGLGTQCNAVAVSCVNNRLISGTGADLGPCLETCNNADDDCDGRIDEGLTCNCQANAEQCNGVDDDCDGTVDEGVTGACSDCCLAACCRFDSNGVCIEDCTAYQDVGECDFGDRLCAGGGFTCVNYEGPQPEICDGLDNDCDGSVDDMAICPNPGDLCVAGQCVFACAQAEFPCPFGFVCKTIPNCGLASCNFCGPDPCLNKSCPSGFQCDNQTGQCSDLCSGVTCQTGSTCRNGFCIDCFQLGCAPGDKCVAGTNGVGVCQADACANAQCGANELCNNGTCVPLTCSPACAKQQSCLNGTCIEDKCEGVQCPAGQVCKPSSGGCLVDPCTDVQCPEGQACQRSTSTCVSDPCALVACPEGTACKLTFDGEATCKAPSTGELVTTGGGGGCSVGAGASSPLLGVLALILRRRRRHATR